MELEVALPLLLFLLLLRTTRQWTAIAAATIAASYYCSLSCQVWRFVPRGAAEDEAFLLPSSDLS